MTTLIRVAAVLAVAALAACTPSNDGPQLADCPPLEEGMDHFYRIESFGNVDVIPEDRKVRILVGVSDSLGNGVSGLSITDFRVLENCEDKVDDLEAETRIDDLSIPFTIRTVLLLDISGSLEGQIPQMKTAVKALLEAKLPEQEFAIYAFDSEVSRLQDFTADLTTLKSVVDQLPESDLDASTNLYQAIIDGAAAWEDVRSVDQIISGSLIVFTDGKHNADPGLTIQDVKNATAGKNLFVAALDAPNLDEAALREIAGNEEKYLSAESITKLGEVFLNIQTRVIRESNSTYFLTYTSPISVDGAQSLRVLLRDNRNTGKDAFVERSFSTNGF